METSYNPFEVIDLKLKQIIQVQEDINRKLDELKKASDGDELISRFEKAKQWGISLPTLRKYETDGIVEAVRKGRKVFFYKNEPHPKAKTLNT